MDNNCENVENNSTTMHQQNEDDLFSPLFQNFGASSEPSTSSMQSPSNMLNKDFSGTTANESRTYSDEPITYTDLTFTYDARVDPTINEKVIDNPETAELRSLLIKWNQEELLEHFIRQKVTIDVLKVIKQHHIEKLLGDDFGLGIQITFEHNLEEWRQSIGIPFIINPMISTLPNQNSFILSDPPSPTSSTSSITRFTPYSRSPTPDEGNRIMLSNILNENPKGIMLAEYHNKFRKFQEEQRSSLINTIAQYFQDKGVQMTLATSYKLEKEILERFPNEKLEYYRTSKRGKLYNKFCNLKTTFKAAVSKHVVASTKSQVPKKQSRQEKDLVVEPDAESCLKTLKFDNLTSEQFDNCWKACSAYRLKDIRNMTCTADVLKKWPFYKTPSGFRLIDMDFRAGFDNGDGLLEKWNTSFTKLISFLSNDNHVKDKYTKGLIECLTRENDHSENSRDAAIFHGLHGYFVPTNKLVKKDTSGKKNIVKFTMKDSQESFLFVGKTHQEVEDHILFLKQKKQSIQPFVICVGEDILSLTEIYVYFDDIKFKFHSFLRAVDICFKTIYVFDLDFPSESIMFWNFIEKYFFNMKSKSSFSKVHVLSEALLNSYSSEVTPL